MTNIPEPTPRQPLDESELEYQKWAEVAIPLVKKAFDEINKKPNAVMFKLDDGRFICFVLHKNNTWDWDNVHTVDVSNMSDKYADLSAQDPFEFVFCDWSETSVKTYNQKTVIPNTSFSKMLDGGLLQKTIENDYNIQYGVKV